MTGISRIVAALLISILCAVHGQAQVLTYLQTIFDSFRLPELVELSPDGKFAYVVKESSVSVLARDETTGKLTFVQEVRSLAFGVQGLDGPQSIAISPGGEHIYIGDVNGIIIFSRDALDGMMNYEDQVLNGENGVSNLINTVSVVVSPDGAHLYAIGLSGGGSLHHFNRNAITGTLTIASVFINNQDGVTNLSSPSAGAIAPDGRHFYVTVGGGSRVNVYTRDASTGELTDVGSIGDGDVGVSNISGPQDLVVSPDGKHVYVAARSSSAIVALSRDDTTGLLTFVTSYRDGNPVGVDGLFNVDDLTISPDGAFLYSAAPNDDAVTAFERDDTTGILTYRGTTFDTSLPEGGLDGVHSVTVSPDGVHLYAPVRNEGAVTILNALATKGTVTLVDVHTDLDGNNGAEGLLGVERFTISPDGKHVYSAGTSENSIGIYARSIQTGRLSYVGIANNINQGSNVIVNPVDLFVSPDNKHLYILSRTQDAIVLFDRDPANGLITFRTKYFDDVGGVANLDNPSRIAGSKDGEIIVVVSNAENGAIFKRDPVTGLLTWTAAMPVLQAPFAEQDDALRDIFFIDGTDQMAASYSFQIANFSISRASGLATFLGSTSSIPALQFLNVGDVVVSPDGRFAYGAQPGNIVTLERNESTGALSLVAASDGGLADVSPTNFGSSITRDGEFFFTGASASIGTGVGVFRRDQSGGTIEAIELFPNGQDNSDGFATVRQTLVSPDSANLYTIDVFDNAIVSFGIGERAALRGTIRSNDAPVTCAVVELTSSNGELVRTAVTDINGDYAFTSLAIDIYDVRLFGVGVMPSVEGTVDLTGGVEVRKNYTMAPSTPSGGVSGVVNDEDTGEPLVAALVEAFIGGVPVGETYTCAGGAYEISGLVTKGVGTAVDIDYSLQNYDTFTDQVAVQGGQVTPANQTLQKSLDAIGSLVGFVFGESESGDVALPGAQLILRGPVNVSAEASGDGGYSFDALLPGDYVIRAASEGYEGESFTQSVPAQGVGVKTFRLEFEMEGEATDLDGDGNINSVDIQLIINAVLGLPSTVDGDVDNNGSTNSVDIQLVILSVLGLL